MTKIFLAVVCLLSSAAVAGSGKYQPLNIKPGEWEITESFSGTGLPDEGRAHTITYKNCVTSKDLNTNPFNDRDQKCVWNVVNSTGNDMEIRASECSLDPNQGMPASVHMKLHVVDSEHVKGTGEWTVNINGQSLNGSATGSGRWIGAKCSGE